MVEDMLDMELLRYFIMKYRQPGASTLFLLWHFDEVLWHDGINAAILSHEWSSLKVLWDIIKLAWKYYPDDLRPEVVKQNETGIEFKHDSKLYISLSIISTTLHRLHISEWCKCADTRVQETMGTVTPTTIITGESTGNGVANDGYLTFQDAKNGDNDFKARFIPWFYQEEYRIELKDESPSKLMKTLSHEEQRFVKMAKTCHNIDITAEQIKYRRFAKKRYKQVYPREMPETEDDCWFTSGHHYFDVAKWRILLNEARDWMRTEQYHERTEDYICFEPPNRKDVFVAGADTSEGTNDNCVLKIINVTQRREAFLFKGRIGETKFYKICDFWCRRYNNAFLLVERNHPGNAVLLGLSEVCGYPNLYKEMDTRRVFQKITDKPKIKYGWLTSSATRPILLAEFKYAVEGDEDVDADHFEPEFTVYDEDLIKEALTFIKVKDKYEAEPGKTDDNIFASSICYQGYKILRPRLKSGQNSSLGILVGDKRTAL